MSYLLNADHSSAAFMSFSLIVPARLRATRLSETHSSTNSSNSIRPLWSLSYLSSSSFALPESISRPTSLSALRSSL